MGDREKDIIPPVYDAAATEGPIYAGWLERGLFTPRPNAAGKPYVIVIPPPNVTAVLHMGHGLNNTVQDVLVRFERMRGRAALWVPGTDHAGIATQNVVERMLGQEGKNRFDLGREAFVERVWAYVRETGGTILEQLKAIGCSCDWSRTRFTLDPAMSRAVREVFVRLWEKDLVYRGHRVIHWCPRCHTALSDEEAEHSETDGKLYHIRYPLSDGSGHVTVATTRPETMLGDVAVAVSPEDEGKRDLVGRTVRLPIAEVDIPIIADEHVDMAFGSGFVKITPAHDADDFDVGVKHKLPSPLVMTDEGVMADLSLEGRPGGRVPEPIFGLDRFEARKRVLAILEGRGLLLRTEPHRHAIRHCYRCDTVVEPRLSDQWFVRMKPLAEPALAAYRSGEIRFIPERRGDEYEQWMSGIRDWNISRQLWWGHRIPVFYCDACGTQKAYREDPPACEKCGGNLRQDEDVLDTWFSSWLWPFSTLGWPDDSEDLKRFYPTDVLVTAPEILFFWVARMVMAGFFCMGKAPFHTVYLHGTVRDTQHRKMSKSLGNGIDPLDVVSRFGADALRFEVTHGLAVGTDIILNPSDLEASFASGRNFANKLWNIGRLLLSALGDRRSKPLEAILPSDFGLADRWILSRLSRAAREATLHMEKFRLNDAVGAPYHFLWDDFADWWLEQAKPRLRDEGADGEVARAVAAHCFDASLRLLHPVLPFITEALWRRLPGNEDRTIVTAEWPAGHAGRDDEAAETDFGFVQAVVEQVRAIRADYGVKPGSMVGAALVGLSPRQRKAVAAERSFLLRMARVSDLSASPPSGAGAHALLPFGAEVFVALGDAIDVAKERARLAEERDRLARQLDSLKAKLANPGFTSRAPAEVVERERAKERDWTEKREALSAKLAALGAK